MPKVSVIIPVYNVEEYIVKCLCSTVNQSLQDIELIFVNDGSTDSSEKYITEYQEIYPKKTIKYFKKENGGLSDARNYGIQQATGEYIAFLDSDDYVEFEAYEYLYEKAKEGDYDMVECNFFWKYPDNRLKKDIGPIYTTKKEALEKARVVAWNKLYKREIITNSDVLFTKGIQYEDVEFFYKILPKLNKIGFVEKPLVYYMQRENSISNTQNEKTRDIFTALGNVIQYYKEKGIYEEYKEELEYTYTRYLLCSSLKRMAKVADENLKKQLFKETWEKLNTTFPEWKKNRILRTGFSWKKLYMRTTNKYTYKLYTRLWEAN